MDRSFSETTVVVTDQEHAADTIVKVDVLEIAGDRDHFADCRGCRTMSHLVSW